MDELDEFAERYESHGYTSFGNVVLVLILFPMVVLIWLQEIGILDWFFAVTVGG